MTIEVVAVTDAHGAVTEAATLAAAQGVHRWQAHKFHFREGVTITSLRFSRKP